MINTTKINIKDVNKQVEIHGFVNKSRRLGDLVFVDLRDLHGLAQVVFDKNSEFYELANKLRNEFTVFIKGEVVERKNKNMEIYSGEVEIIPTYLEIISEAKTTPLIIAEKTDALEPVRLRYKYLDLRRPNIRQNILTRSQFNKTIRDYMYAHDFIEVETPVLTKGSEGGAKEFTVRAQNQNEQEYSLVQSPQIYKQLLMVGGFEKYFQIAKCFRDEASRSDRQVEFTQLDIELAYADESKIQTLIEGLVIDIMKKVKGTTINGHFPKMTYAQAMHDYGSDKPDTRFDNKLLDLTNVFKHSKTFLASKVAEGKAVRAVVFNEVLSNSYLKTIEDDIKQQGAEFAKVIVENGAAKGIKDLSNEEVSHITKESKATIIFAIGEFEKATEVLGRIRVTVAKHLNLIDENKFNYLWVIDWPLFELADDNQLVAKHNPFTSVFENEISTFKKLTSKDVKELLKLHARSYDLVLNGSEIGGGSIRFTNPELQRKAFEIMNFSKEKIDSQFKWLLEAYEYGAPRHGGIALGLDRWIAILLGQESIREVIAFPKSTAGVDEMIKKHED